MIATRYYRAGNLVTLFDVKKNKRFKGVLYINEVGGSANLRLPENIWERMSKMFLGLAVLGFIAIFYPPIYADVSYRVSSFFKAPQVIPALAEVPVSEEFYLEIPKINLVSQIIPNVDAENEQTYLEKLKLGVAHARGSYLPGDNGPVVLFSHSTDTLAHIIQYNAKFYALKDLQEGDQVTIHFKGKIYTYTVTEKKIINPKDLDTIRNSGAKLIMTTCWPPGTDWQRLAVFLS